jgi:hypothetical protein
MVPLFVGVEEDPPDEPEVAPSGPAAPPEVGLPMTTTYSD